jgi:hypothetical protein
MESGPSNDVHVLHLGTLEWVSACGIRSCHDAVLLCVCPCVCVCVCVCVCARATIKIICLEKSRNAETYLLSLSCTTPPKQGALRCKGDVPKARYEAGVAALPNGSGVIVFGGASHDKNFNDTHVLDLSHGQSNATWVSRSLHSIIDAHLLTAFFPHL